MKIIKFIKSKLRPNYGTNLANLLDKGFKVGKNFNMEHGCIIDDSHFWHIEIGDNVTLAPRVHILAHDASTKMYLNYTKIKNVKIGNNVFIGAGSIIMPGVEIGDGSIIGAGSVVTKHVPSNSVYAGNPAKFICFSSDYIARQKQLMNQHNTFDEDYTVRRNIDQEKMGLMKKAVEDVGVGFVI